MGATGNGKAHGRARALGGLGREKGGDRGGAHVVATTSTKRSEG